MPRATSIDRGYLDLPSAYYTTSPTRSTFTHDNNNKNDSSSSAGRSSSAAFAQPAAAEDDGTSGSPIARAFRTLHERRKSRAELEEEMWFRGLVGTEEERRKHRERCWLAGVAAVLGWVLLAWWLLR